MRFLAIAIKHLIEQGADPLAIQRFVDEVAREGGAELPPIDEVAERKRAYNREYMRRLRSPSSATSLLKEAPHTPQENNIYITKPEKAKKGTRLPSDWSPSLEALSYVDKLGFSAAEISSAVEDFRLWAAAASGQVAIKRDWESAFKGWMRREKAKKGSQGGFRPGKVVQGSFRKEFAPEPPKPVLTDEQKAEVNLKLNQAKANLRGWK